MEKVKSIKEIARLAGVSTATVSRVINQNGRFSKETEARVRSIIRQTEYVPNMSAKGLRTNRTRVVGLVVPDITNPHFSSLVLKLEMNFFEHGYSCLICNTNESEKLERKHIHTLSAQNVSGIVLISGTRNYPELEDVPVIYLDRPSRSQENSGIMIESDNEEGGYLATKELLDAGCTHPVILKCLNSDTNQLSRYRGFQRALAERGIVEDPHLYVDLPEVTSEKANDAIVWLLEKGFHFDGIMCTTDTIAAGALIALREHGLSVPGDVLVTGFDDTQLAVACGPGITSVHQDVSKMAQMATELLLEMICGKTPQQTYYLLPVRLNVRASTRR